MPDYQKGIIYKIYNIDEPENFYVGSTTMKLWHRLGLHKTLCKKSISLFYQEVKRLGWDKFKMELIKDFPCNNRQELFAEEERVRSETDAYYNTSVHFFLKNNIRLKCLNTTSNTMKNTSLKCNNTENDMLENTRTKYNNT